MVVGLCGNGSGCLAMVLKTGVEWLKGVVLHSYEHEVEVALTYWGLTVNRMGYSLHL